ncbi:hypothetical protein B0T17DRAFT_544983 [Bombardia bombarda]|uniref:FAD-binding domain-containing protein n=1 Tax=Bombardia bombarda TaxID=252184 RepID=A0AA39W438_9PEZI|nr:hypothetical protein B0T17DRAFT_544983 [Bombardia bombarda]
MAPFRPRIAIAGGGPSGVALALLLHRRGIPTTVFELRSKPTAVELARPSGMLDLHEESGLQTMRACGLLDAFQASVGDCSEAMRIVTSQNKLLHADEGTEDSQRPEIPRNVLTDLFVKNLPEGTIRWGQKALDAELACNSATGATEVMLKLGETTSGGDTTTATFDFVVGSDGAWSRIRRLVSDVRPSYSGVQFVTATVRLASTKYPRLVDLCGSGSLIALGGGNGILTHRGPQDSIRVYASVGTPDEHWAETAGLMGQTAAQVKTRLLADEGLFGKWAPGLKDLLATACDEETRDNPGLVADIMPLSELPVGYRWEHRMGVTLVGDAAHLMTPFAGEGVNVALWDVLDLAEVLGGVHGVKNATEWQAVVDERVGRFEEGMQARAKEKAGETMRNKEMMMGESGAEAMSQAMAQAMAAVKQRQMHLS